MQFTVTLIAVGTMLLYAVPGYLFVRFKLIKKEAIAAFATVLMYLCQPCLTLYSFQNSRYTQGFWKVIVFFFFFGLIFMGLMMVLSYLAVRKKAGDARYRIAAIANVFGNCGFLGIPLLEAVLPGEPKALVLASVFMAAMNVLGWSAGSAIIARDKKYISAKKIFLNPAILALVMALPMFFLHYTLPGQLLNLVTVLGKMTTPLCMLIMGMRLATMGIKEIFEDHLVYVSIFIKQMVMPALALFTIMALPLDLYVKQTMFIVCATPVASVVLNFAEMIGEGQKTAANMVLLGTALSVITIPVMVLFMGMFL